MGAAEATVRGNAIRCCIAPDKLVPFMSGSQARARAVDDDAAHGETDLTLAGNTVAVAVDGDGDSALGDGDSALGLGFMLGLNVKMEAAEDRSRQSSWPLAVALDGDPGCGPQSGLTAGPDETLAEPKPRGGVGDMAMVTVPEDSGFTMGAAAAASFQPPAVGDP